MRYTGRLASTLVFILIFVMFLTIIFSYLPIDLIYWHLGIVFLLSLLLAWYLGFYYDKTKFKSLQDNLTSTYNRSYLYEVFPKLITQMEREKSEMSIMILDLDDLKNINDTEGHQKGDELLKRLSHLIQSNIRECDIFVRWGGDEFIIVAPFMNYDQMETMIDKIINIQRLDRIHFSFGISCYPNDAQDLNELIKKADERLYQMKESKKGVRYEKRYQKFLKFLPEPIIVHSEGTILYVNKVAVQLVKAKDDAELVGKSIFNFLHPGNHAESKEITQQLMQEDEASDFKQRLIYCMTRELIEIEVSSIRIDSYDKGKPVILSLLRDITERKKAEALLVQSEKLSIIGQLAAGVAHEIRNPLTSLMGFTKVLKAKSTDQDTFHFDIMQQELERINLIVNDFMTLAKPSSHEFKNGNIVEIFKNVISILETQAIMTNVNIKKNYMDEVPLIYCNENELKQVFLNIIKNAIEAMPYGGDVTITINEATKSGKLHIEIKDQGIGIQPDAIKKIGKPFFTTKEKGTGLGLIVTQRIIELHQGSFHISSNGINGTTVDVYLPNLSQLTISDV